MRAISKWTCSVIYYWTCFNCGNAKNTPQNWVCRKCGVARDQN